MARQVQDNGKFTGIRLPTDVKPIHYDIKIKPDLKDFTYQGEIQIQYESKEPTNKIVLHACEVVIKDGNINNKTGVNPLECVYYSQDSETATLEFSNNIESSGSLSLKFTGIINDQLKGFYRTDFKIGETSLTAATTQFAAVDARRCFPCWDEPNIKATFTVSLVVPKFIEANNQKYECLALSNMNEVSRSGDDEVTVNFAKSPIMSTYLLAFVVGPFEALEGADMRRPIRVFTTPGKKEQAKFALDVACKSLSFYEDYFGVMYPLPKMDLIAVPDFSFGAMENWGLVTYKESCLLVDPENTSTQAKQYVAVIVAHELAHQWFGNLVTMDWWTHLWLNEGFATFMQYLCADHLFPEYDIWSQFVTDAYGRAMDLDALHSSHPIEVPIKHPSEIDEIFDVISYNKGAAVIRMLYEYIGDDCFRKGMKTYLTHFAYKNASTEDLWDHLEAASNKPVRKIMSGWTSQKGYPWLSVNYNVEEDGVKLSLTQNKFTADGNVPSDEADMTWMIPISAICGDKPSDTQELGLLQDKTTEVDIGGAKDTWVKLNPDSIGLYRSAYPDGMMRKLQPAISDQTLGPLDRLGIQSDYFALCQAGKVDSVQLLRLLRVFKSETTYPVWSSIDKCFSKLSTILQPTDFKELLHKFGRELYSEIFQKLGWSAKAEEKHVDALTRALVINRLVTFGDEAVIAEAKRSFAAHVAKTETIPADLRGPIYKAVSIHGDEEAFQSLFDIYRASDLQEEKNRAARALCFSKVGERLDKVLEFIMSDEVRIQDKPSLIIVVGVSNPDVGWKFFQDNMKYIHEKYGSGILLPRLVKCMIEEFCSETKAREIEEFFKTNKFTGIERSVQQGLETIRLNASWLARDSEAMKAYLEEDRAYDDDDDEEDDDEDEDDDVKVTIDQIEDYSQFRSVPKQAQATKPAVNIECAQTIDPQSVDEKPWRRPGADISDYFNYGFDEATWTLYCEKQKEKREAAETAQETYKIPVVSEMAYPNPVVPMQYNTPMPIQQLLPPTPQIILPTQSSGRERERRVSPREMQREPPRDSLREPMREPPRESRSSRHSERPREHSSRSRGSPRRRSREKKRRTRSRSRDDDRNRSKRHKSSRSGRR